MKQLKQIEIQGQDSAIQPDNVVRLLQPFRPERYSSQEYALAIVVGIVRDDFISRSSRSSSAYKQIAEGHQLRLGGVVIYLYEPQSATIYFDHSGTQALFSFDFDEIEPMF